MRILLLLLMALTGCADYGITRIAKDLPPDLEGKIVVIEFRSDASQQCAQRMQIFGSLACVRWAGHSTQSLPAVDCAIISPLSYAAVQHELNVCANPSTYWNKTQGHPQ